MKQLKLFSMLLLLLFSAGAKAQFAWYGSEGVAQVETNLPEGTGINQGVWWVATDYADGGKSKVVWDDGTVNDNPDDALVQTYGGISGTAVLERNELPYAPRVSVGFCVAGLNSSDQQVVADASAWGGIAISYSCDVPVTIELGLGDVVDKNIGYANPIVDLPAAPDGTFKRIPWSDFKYQSWGYSSERIDGPEASTKLYAIKFRVGHKDNGSYKFKISAIGSYEMSQTPPLSTQCKLKISATGNGSAKYGSTTINNNTNEFVVDKGTNHTITFSPDAGYKIKSVKVGATDVTSSLADNSYTVTDIQTNTKVAVEFVALSTYELNISATGNGSASFNETTIRNGSNTFNVVEGTDATITFNPDAGYTVKSLKLGSLDVTSSVTANSYTLSNIQGNATLTVEFDEIPPEQCATPTIDFVDGELRFECDTEEAQFVYEITNADVRTGSTYYKAKLGGSEKASVFKVSVYAKKPGFADSEVVTKEIKVSFVGDLNNDGKTDVKDVVNLVNEITK